MTTSLNINELTELLSTKVVNIDYTKVDGTTRIIKATLSTDYWVTEQEKSASIDSALTDNVIPVWDTENNGWRSLLFTGINSYSE